MLVETLHALADIGNVGENGLLVSFPENLGRGDLVVPSSIAGKVWVLRPEKRKEAGEKEGVGEVDGAGSVPDPSTSDKVTGILGLDLLHSLLSILRLAGNNTSLGKLGIESVRDGLLGGLLLLSLLHRGGVELSIGASGGLVAILIGGLGLLLLLLEVLELLREVGNLLVVIFIGTCKVEIVSVWSSLE